MSQNSMLTPTEQGAISKALTEVITARNSGQIEYYWRCLETLYITCLGLKKCHDTLKEQVEPIYDNLNNLSAKGYDHTTMHNQLMRMQIAYMVRNSGKIHRIIIEALRDGNYSEIALGASPRYNSIPELRTDA